MQKSLEAFLEQGLLDRQLFMPSTKDSAEMLELQNRFLLEKGERQSIGVAANYFCLASPIMPFGLLSTFFLLNKLDDFDKGPLAQGRLKNEMARIVAAEALACKKKRQGESLDEFTCLLARRTPAMSWAFGTRHILNNAEKQVLPKYKGRESMLVAKDKASSKKRLHKPAWHGQDNLVIRPELSKKFSLG